MGRGAVKEPVPAEILDPPTKEAQAAGLDSAADDLVADVVHVAMVLTGDEEDDVQDESTTDLQMDEGAKESSAPGKENVDETPKESSTSEAETGSKSLSDPSVLDEEPKQDTP